jgi:hypothetical protein
MVSCRREELLPLSVVKERLSGQEINEACFLGVLVRKTDGEIEPSEETTGNRLLEQKPADQNTRIFYLEGLA